MASPQNWVSGLSMGKCLPIQSLAAGVSGRSRNSEAWFSSRKSSSVVDDFWILVEFGISFLRVSEKAARCASWGKAARWDFAPSGRIPPDSGGWHRGLVSGSVAGARTERPLLILRHFTMGTETAARVRKYLRYCVQNWFGWDGLAGKKRTRYFAVSMHGELPSLCMLGVIVPCRGRWLRLLLLSRPAAFLAVQSCRIGFCLRADRATDAPQLRIERFEFGRNFPCHD